MNQHLFKQVETFGAQSLNDLAEVLLLVNVEVGLVSLQLCDPGPLVGSWGTSDAKDFVKLIVLVLSREQRPLGHDFCEDAPDRPNVDGSVVVFRAHQDIGSSIPKSDDLVCEVLDGNSERTRQTEIGELENSFLVDEEVLGLEVSMKDFVLVALGDSVEQLVEIGFDLVFHQQALGLVEKLLEVLVEEFEHKGELLVGVEHINQPDNIWMLQLFQEGDLSDSGGGDTFILGLESNGLECVDFSGVDISGLVDHSIGSLAHLF